MTKPTTKSPTERRLRKDIRPLLQAYKAGTIKEDQAVRELLALIDDEVRRTRMSMKPVIYHGTKPEDRTTGLPSWLVTRLPSEVTQ